DMKDLDFAHKNEVEWIALSFVRRASDVNDLKEIIKSQGKKTKVIAKIEKPEAVQNMNEIIEVADAIMVARGDLGVEMLMEEIPIIQKILVKKAIAAAKPVIIATQMMESMIDNYRPTRAEANDVGNAVIDGADAVMLSAETSVGKYPVEVVESMYKIILLAQNDENIYNRGNPPDKNSPLFISDSVCYNSTIMADQSGARAIVAMTHSGFTAFKIASQRPHSDILIFTDNKPIVKMLTLIWGVQGFFYDKYTTSDETISDVKEILKKHGFVEPGDILVHIASMPIHERATANTIKLNFVE
ncbi:MAG: pyruvate kinase, partial [Bacteroidia bacterium]|nr:pyruvate kinase [Bacteroidia bacterium]